MEKVTVLMSTYNGERYIRQQIDSILAQKNIGVKLVIRDDLSSDSTIDILAEYMRKYSNIYYYKGGTRKGACGSFLELLAKNYDTKYFALSDQDDVWDEDKLFVAVNKIKELGENDIPVLYYSNLRIVDRDLFYIRESHIKPMIPGSKYSFLSDVFVTGCTAVFNDKLQKIAVEVKPAEFSMHDTWLYITSSIFGKCIYDFNSHMDYRQHNNNVVGTRKKRVGIESVIREIKNYFNWKEQPRLECAKEILSEFEDRLDEDAIEKINEFIHYKDSVRATLKLAFDRDLDSSNLYRRLRFKITVLLRNA